VKPSTGQPSSKPSAETVPSGPPHIAQSMLSQFGWPSSQFSCLEPFWQQESGGSVTAQIPGSG
jgi:hypothetical protein